MRVLVHYVDAKLKTVAREIEYDILQMGHETADFLNEAELIISLGGDGTLLRKVDDAARLDIPILGINYGTLGYMTIAPDHWERVFRSFTGGHMMPSYRMMLFAKTQPQWGSSYRAAHALNEVYIGKVDTGSLVELVVTVDDQSFHTYRCDGLIVATPTGSTAYNLSAGGPIIDPACAQIIIKPVASHGMFDRAVVLPANADIQVTCIGREHASVVVDGRTVEKIQELDSVNITQSPRSAQILTNQPFFETVKTKFMGY